MNAKSRKAECEGCGNSPRQLTQIESGQWVCRTCLREIRGGLSQKDFASNKQIGYLRNNGFDVPDRLLKTEYFRLSALSELRRTYPDLPEDTPAEELERLRIIVWLSNKGISVDEQTPLEVLLAMEQRETEVRRLFTKVVGVTHKNRDGTDRQVVIGKCRVMDELLLRHEHDNPVDSNAVAVCRINGEQLGYLQSDLAGEIVRASLRGRRHCPFVVAITGGTDRCPSLGVNLAVVIVEPGVSIQRVREYIRENMRTWFEDRVDWRE